MYKTPKARIDGLRKIQILHAAVGFMTEVDHQAFSKMFSISQCSAFACLLSSRPPPPNKTGQTQTTSKKLAGKGGGSGAIDHAYIRAGLEDAWKEFYSGPLPRPQNLKNLHRQSIEELREESERAMDPDSARPGKTVPERQGTQAVDVKAPQSANAVQSEVTMVTAVQQPGHFSWPRVSRRVEPFSQGPPLFPPPTLPPPPPGQNGPKPASAAGPVSSTAAVAPVHPVPPRTLSLGPTPRSAQMKSAANARLTGFTVNSAQSLKESLEKKPLSRAEKTSTNSSLAYAEVDVISPQPRSSHSLPSRRTKPTPPIRKESKDIALRSPLFANSPPSPLCFTSRFSPQTKAVSCSVLPGTVSPSVKEPLVSMNAPGFCHVGSERSAFSRMMSASQPRLSRTTSLPVRPNPILPTSIFSGKLLSNESTRQWEQYR